MADYIALLKEDLVEQFKGKANIESLAEVVGAELQQVFDFYQQLRDERDVYTAVGKQLDGVGNIVDMTRKEAGKLAGDPIPFNIIDDDTYRQYLIYKILKNNSDCTYPEIIKAFRMFWDKPLYYTEDPDQPATMIFDTGEMPGTVDTTPLFRTPLIRAAGVTLKLYARTKTEMDPANVYLLSGLGYAVTESILPVLEREYDLSTQVYVRSGVISVAEDTIPGYEREYHLGYKLHLGSAMQGILESGMPDVERNIDYAASVWTGSAVNSVIETPIGDVEMRSPTRQVVARAATNRPKLQMLQEMTARVTQASGTVSKLRSTSKSANKKTNEGGTQK